MTDQIDVNKKEYDAFGPWIYEIDNEHEIPRLFRNYINSEDKYQLLLKVPRKIERRKASPRMDLYECLIGANDKQLYILKKEANSVKERLIDYNDIQAIKDIHALLKGQLILFTENDTVTVDYNTVSEDIIKKLISIIEGRRNSVQTLQFQSIPVEYLPDKEDSLDLLYINLINKTKLIRPEIELIAYQQAMGRNPAKLINNSKSKSGGQTNTAYISDGKELIVIERVMSSIRKGKEELSYYYVYLPFQNITKVKIEYIDKQQMVCIMKVSVNTHTFNFLFDRNNKMIMEIYRKIKSLLQL